MLIEEPKEFLKEISSKYNESDNPEIFQKLDFETVVSECKYFEVFINRLDRLML